MVVPHDATSDVILVGSGAGAAAAAYALVRGGCKVLMLEKGQQLPQSAQLIDLSAFENSQYLNQQVWFGADGRRFVPTEFFNVGGKTKWYGAALLRLRPEEFNSDLDHECQEWPFSYDDLVPYYDEAERLLGVRTFSDEPALFRLMRKIRRHDPHWQCETLPLALASAILADNVEASSFDGRPSGKGYKGDAERSLLDRISRFPLFRLEAESEVVDLLHRHDDPAHIEGVVCADGRRYFARKVVLAAGAMTSPRILQRHLRASELGHRLPSAPMVGAGIQLHLNTAMFAVGIRPHGSILCKTAFFRNDRFPHSTVQCLGKIGNERFARIAGRIAPAWMRGQIASRVLGFFVMTEDGRSLLNRVTSRSDGVPILDYKSDRVKQAMAEHKGVTSTFARRLARAGFLPISKLVGVQGTAHAVGTMATGVDPRRSVVDPTGAVHGMRGLYVADGSALPRIGSVNPALTIYAWGLRVGTLLVNSLAKERLESDGVTL